jgi:hypothetical protein
MNFLAAPNCSKSHELCKRQYGIEQGITIQQWYSRGTDGGYAAANIPLPSTVAQLHYAICIANKENCPPGH